MRFACTIWILAAIAVFATPLARAQASNSAAVGILLTNAPQGTGVQVVRVVPNSPAERAHIIPGDVITSLGFGRVSSVSEFQSIVGSFAPGTVLGISIERAGRFVRENITVATRTQIAAAGNFCDAQAAGANLARARTATARHEAAAASEYAELARNRFDACAVAANSATYYAFVMDDADAQLLLAAGYAARGDRGTASLIALHARDYLSVIADGEDASSAQRLLATHKIDAIDRAFPSLLDVPPNDIFVPKMAIASDDAKASTFSVLASWTSPGNSELQVLHIRINLHPSQPTTFAGNMFRVRISSPTAGTETVYGLAQQAPSYQRVDWSNSAPNAAITKPDVDPSEDLGYMRSLMLNAGDAKTVVVSFIVRSDADVSDAVQTLQLLSP